MRKNSEFSMNIGLPSILLIFVILCLVSFGILSFVSARSDYKLSQKVLTRSDKYYETCNQAEDMLANTLQQLKNAYHSCSNEATYQEFIKNIPVDYYYPLSELQHLHVNLSFLYPDTIEGDFYQINTWQIITNTDINYDNQLHVIP